MSQISRSVVTNESTGGKESEERWHTGLTYFSQVWRLSKRASMASAFSRRQPKLTEQNSTVAPDIPPHAVSLAPTNSCMLWRLPPDCFLHCHLHFQCPGPKWAENLHKKSVRLPNLLYTLYFLVFVMHGWAHEDTPKTPKSLRHAAYVHEDESNVAMVSYRKRRLHCLTKVWIVYLKQVLTDKNVHQRQREVIETSSAHPLFHWEWLVSIYTSAQSDMTLTKHWGPSRVQSIYCPVHQTRTFALPHTARADIWESSGLQWKCESSTSHLRHKLMPKSHRYNSWNWECYMFNDWKRY